MFFGFEGERVNMWNALLAGGAVGGIGATRMMLVSLNCGKVFTISFFETVVSVKLKKSGIHLLVQVGGGGLHSPYQFFYRVVKSKFMLSTSVCKSKRVGVLNLFNEVFMRDLGETAALVRVKENVIAPDTNGTEI
jgi:hypothetical protein